MPHDSDGSTTLASSDTEESRDQVLRAGTISLSRLADGRLVARVEDLDAVEREELRRRRTELRQIVIPGLEPAEALEDDAEAIRVFWRAPGQHLAKRTETAPTARDDADSAVEVNRLLCQSLARVLADLHQQGLAHGCLIPHLVWGSTSPLLLGAELGPWIAKNRAALPNELLRYLPPRDESDQVQTERSMQRADLYGLGLLMLDAFVGSNQAKDVINKWHKQNGRSRMALHRLVRKKSQHRLPWQWTALAVRLVARDTRTTARDVETGLVSRTRIRYKRFMQAAVVFVIAIAGGLALGWSYAVAKASRLQEHNLALTAEMTTLEEENARLRREGQPGVPPPDPAPIRAETDRIWREWTQMQTGCTDDLHERRRAMIPEWQVKFGHEQAGRINEGLETRLGDVQRQRQWRLTLDSITGTDNEELWLRVEIDGRSAFDQTRVKLVRVGGRWALPRSYDRIEWRPCQTIRVRVQGWTWWTSRYYTIIDETRQGPLALWQIAHVTDMGWPQEEATRPLLRSNSGETLRITVRPDIALPNNPLNILNLGERP